jgi:prolyl-tRNA synthetase
LHTAHTSKAEAIEQTLKMIKVYKDFVNYFLCIPVLMGEKTEGERFAGAENTYTIEALMQDGQALQCGTSHYLGQNFSKTYEIQYQTKDNKFDFIHQTSAGLSTRIIGAIIMSHADDKGLVLPVGVAPTQVAILPILADKHPKVNEVVQDVYKTLGRNFRVSIDETNNSFGFKISNQEVHGTPISIAIGPKDVDNGSCILIRRDNGEKQTVSLKEIDKVVKAQVLAYQKAIYVKAEDRLNSSIVDVNNIDEFNDVIKSKKIAKAYWGGNTDDEKQLKEKTGASPRCIFKETETGHACFFTNKQAKYIVYFARAY